jgi:hypothetical protein
MAKRRSQDAPRLGFRPKKSIKKTGTDVHVGNLPPNTKSGEIFKLFKGFGRIVGRITVKHKKLTASPVGQRGWSVASCVHPLSCCCVLLKLTAARCAASRSSRSPSATRL